MQKALTLLSKRKYTVLAMKKKLKLFFDKQVEKGTFMQVTDTERETKLKEVLTRLKELNYLNDTDYAETYISDRLEFHPRGKFLIKRELKNKGIHPELAERVADEKYQNEDEIALKTLEKRMKRLTNLPKHEQKEKVMRFLASRGFKIDAIYKAINSWYNDIEIS
jgi:regulatory protein